MPARSIACASRETTIAANFGELKTAVSTALTRPDLDSVVPHFCNAALARVNQELALAGGIVDQEQMAYASTVVGDDSLPLPSDFDRLDYIKLSTDPPDTLEDAGTVSALVDEFGDESGTPQKYTVFANAIIFRPIPDAIYTVRIGYFKRYPAFSADSDTNYLLMQGGNLLVYGACIEATPQMHDDMRLAMWGASFKEAMRLFIAANLRAKRGPKAAEARVDTALLAVGNGGSVNILTGL